MSVLSVKSLIEAQFDIYKIENFPFLVIHVQFDPRKLISSQKIPINIIFLCPVILNPTEKPA